MGHKMKFGCLTLYSLPLKQCLKVSAQIKTEYIVYLFLFKKTCFSEEMPEINRQWPALSHDFGWENLCIGRCEIKFLLFYSGCR